MSGERETPRLHGATTIQGWLDDLVTLACSGGEFHTSAGAEPERPYAYLEFRSHGGERHSLLLFTVQGSVGVPRIVAHRIDGDGPTVQAAVQRLKHPELEREPSQGEEGRWRRSSRAAPTRGGS